MLEENPREIIPEKTHAFNFVTESPIYIVPLVGFKPGSSKWHTFWLSLGEKQQEPLDSDSEEVLNLQDVNELTGEAAEGDGVESVVNELTKQQVLVKYLQVTGY